MAPPRVVKVKKAVLKECLTCPLCHKLLRHATTVSECLHSFCRKCIYEKLTHEELGCCPICDIDLGGSPVEKLRPDHSLQDVRAKIFPLKRAKAGVLVVSPIPLPVKIKKRSLSSLVIDTPEISTLSGLTTKRTQLDARKIDASQCSISPVQVPTKKENGPENWENSYPEASCKKSRSKSKSASNGEPSDISSKNDLENTMEPFADKTELWKPLNCLAEVANQTKTIKCTLLNSAVTEQNISTDRESHLHVRNTREHTSKFRSQNDKNGSASTMFPKFRRQRRRTTTNCDLYNSAQSSLEAASAKDEQRASAIWFNLIASTSHEPNCLLPQTSACYLRIKDGTLPASLIQKYLATKLELTNENEVDITCWGQPVPPTLELRKLVDFWLQKGPCTKSQATIGTSAKEFVMILNYTCKICPR